MDPAFRKRFFDALPRVRAWIEATRAAHEARAVPFSDVATPRLAACLPAELLRRARVVAVPQPPFPPLAELGLPELADVTRMDISGVTYGDLVFVHEARISESLHFHELVHVVQWDTLGPDRFLVAYGIGLLAFGYRASPVETMAYDLGERFDRGEALTDVVGEVAAKTRALGRDVEAALANGA